MTTGQIIIILIALISIVKLSSDALANAIRNQNLSKVIVVTCCYIFSLIFIGLAFVQTIEFNKVNNKHSCPTLEKAEDVYRIK